MPLPIPEEITSMISAELNSEGDQRSLRNFALTNRAIHRITFPHVDHTGYVIFDGLKAPDDVPSLVPGYSKKSREGRKYLLSRFVDSHLMDVELPSTMPGMQNSAGDEVDKVAEAKPNIVGPLLQFLRELETNRYMCTNVHKLVIKSRCEHFDRASYWIDPQLLSEVLNKLVNLRALSVGQLGVQCPKKRTLGLRLNILEARWEELLPTALSDMINPRLRYDTTSFCDLMALFSGIEELRFAYSTKFMTSTSLLPCTTRPSHYPGLRPAIATHDLVAVRKVHLVPPSGPISCMTREILRFLGLTLKPLAIEELVVDDLCQIAVEEINQLVANATNISRLSLNFQQPTKRGRIRECYRPCGITDMAHLIS